MDSDFFGHFGFGNFSSVTPGGILKSQKDGSGGPGPEFDGGGCDRLMARLSAVCALVDLGLTRFGARLITLVVLTARLGLGSLPSSLLSYRTYTCTTDS